MIMQTLDLDRALALDPHRATDCPAAVTPVSRPASPHRSADSLSAPERGVHAASSNINGGASVPASRSHPPTATRFNNPAQGCTDRGATLGSEENPINSERVTSPLHRSADSLSAQDSEISNLHSEMTGPNLRPPTSDLGPPSSDLRSGRTSKRCLNADAIKLRHRMIRRARTRAKLGRWWMRQCHSDRSADSLSASESINHQPSTISR